MQVLALKYGAHGQQEAMVKLFDSNGITSTKEHVLASHSHHQESSSTRLNPAFHLVMSLSSQLRNFTILSRSLPDEHCMTRFSLVPETRLQLHHRLLYCPQCPTAICLPTPELLACGRVVGNHLDGLICTCVAGNLLVFPHHLLFGFAEEEGCAIG